MRWHSGLGEARGGSPRDGGDGRVGRSWLGKKRWRKRGHSGGVCFGVGETPGGGQAGCYLRRHDEERGKSTRRQDNLEGSQHV